MDVPGLGCCLRSSIVLSWPHPSLAAALGRVGLLTTLGSMVELAMVARVKVS